MVDKSTARALVYGTIGTLAVLLLIAVVALNSKSSLQSRLDEKLAELRSKEEKARAAASEELAARAAAQSQRRRAEEAEKSRLKAEEQRAARSRTLDQSVKEKETVKDEAKQLRKERRKADREAQKRAHRDEPSMGPDPDEEKEYAEYLSGLSDEELEKQIAEETAEFERQRRDLGEEHLKGDDAEDLKKELEKADEMIKQSKVLTVNMSGAADAAANLERLQELGEQNEVFLEDLKRDAKRDSKRKSGRQWKEGTRPQVMERLAHQIDTRAEVLRHRGEKKRLDDSRAKLNTVEFKARETFDKPFINQVVGAVEELQSEEQREERLMDQGDDDLALKQANALEEYARAVQEQVEQLERNYKENPNMSEKEKKEHNDVLSLLEQELVNIEGVANGIEQAYERRQMRLGTVELSKQANALDSQDEAMVKLKHAKSVYKKVGEMLPKEWELLSAMKNTSASDPEQRERQKLHVEELSRELEHQNEEIEEEASQLRKEVDAHNFNTLDEKLDAEAIASELHHKADEMQTAASTIEHDDERRRLLEEAQQVRALAFEAAKGKPEMLAIAKKLSDDLKGVAYAVAANDGEAEVEQVKQALVDLQALSEGAQELEKDLHDDANKYTPEQRKEIEDAIKEMTQHSNKIKKELKNVDVQVRMKAAVELEKLEKEQKRLQKVKKN